MDFQLKPTDFAQTCAAPADVLMVLVPEGFAAPGDAGSAIAQAIAAGDFATKAGSMLALYGVKGFGARRVLCLGVGAAGAKELRAAVTAGFASVKGTNPGSLAVCVAGLPAFTQSHAQAVVWACADASYVYTTTKPKADARSLKAVTIGAGAHGAGATEAVAQAAAVVVGVELAKEWANRPGNYATPTLLADAAKAMAKTNKIDCEVLGPAQVKKLKMGSFMAVSQGSAEPLRFVVLRYNGGPKTQAPIVLVGKGVTFDTGGISIKPAAEMDEMKFDMGGAASVMGTFAALGKLKPKINVVGLIAACENMPDGRAVKPGDVVTTMSGQTIEILNTDAEGRLILCDALTYAERFKPACVVDIATLTGACVIALGAVRSGMYATTDELGSALSAAGEQTGDLCWRMPLDDEYSEGLKSNFADVGNIAGRAGGSITAAKFLQRFASKFTWGHLDIAGTAWKGGGAKGATGRPVALLTQFVLNAAVRPITATAVPAPAKAASSKPALSKPAAKTMVKAKPAKPAKPAKVDAAMPKPSKPAKTAKA